MHETHTWGVSLLSCNADLNCHKTFSLRKEGRESGQSQYNRTRTLNLYMYFRRKIEKKKKEVPNPGYVSICHFAT